MNKTIKKIIIYISILAFVISISTYSNAAESAKAFGNGDTSGKHGVYLYTYIDDMDFAYGGFLKLGYNASTSRAYYNNIMSWINSSSNNYGFYITTHGPANGSSDDYFISEEGTRIYPSNINGNWHLVYIDACNSKKNNSFANAFKVSGYSNRAYLGWATEVGITSANQYNDYFWNTYVGTRSIQAAAVAAAGEVPGSGTTPIRFSGDANWWGYSS